MGNCGTKADYFRHSCGGLTDNLLVECQQYYSDQWDTAHNMDVALVTALAIGRGPWRDVCRLSITVAKPAS